VPALSRGRPRSIAMSAISDSRGRPLLADLGLIVHGRNST